MRNHFRLIAAATIAALLGVLAMFARPGADAGAQVVHGTGHEATVMGWTSWYGSYVLEGVGVVWCIDHGLRAPDVDYGYRPTAQPAIPVENRTAMAWILARHGTDPSRLDAAAVMLALHDLNGAVYPQGPLDLRSLSADRFAGFSGDDAAVLDRAVRILQDGIDHSDLRGPITLELSAPPQGRPGDVVSVTASLHDADGRPVAGIGIGLRIDGGAAGSPGGTTGPDGTIHVPVTMGADTLDLTATATVPSLELIVHGPSGAPAQRVGSSDTHDLSAAARIQAPPTTTTTTTVPETTTTTTTTPPTTTSTTVPETTTTTTTTTPPTTTSTTVPGTTVPETSTTTTTVPASSTTTPAVVPPAPQPPRDGTPPTPRRVATPTPPGTLAVTGGRSLGFALVGSGLVLAGTATLLATGTRRRRG